MDDIEGIGVGAGSMGLFGAVTFALLKWSSSRNVHAIDDALMELKQGMGDVLAELKQQGRDAVRTESGLNGLIERVDALENRLEAFARKWEDASLEAARSHRAEFEKYQASVHEWKNEVLEVVTRRTRK